MDELPTTSQPSIGDYILLLESLRSEGFTDVISVHLSGAISGTYQNAMAAGQSVEGIEVHAVDSEVACYVQGFMALYAAQIRNAYFVVDTLSNLQKGRNASW